MSQQQPLRLSRKPGPRLSQAHRLPSVGLETEVQMRNRFLNSLHVTLSFSHNEHLYSLMVYRFFLNPHSLLFKNNTGLKKLLFLLCFLFF